MQGAENLKRYIAQALERAESLFERLVFVASLRDSYTGRYLHQGWSGVAASEEVHAVLKTVHESLFKSGLSLSVLELSKELRFHFRTREQTERETSILWLETEPFRDLIPRGCSHALREFFISQMRAALEVLCRAPEWGEIAGPIASLRSQLDQPPLLRWLD